MTGQAGNISAMIRVIMHPSPRYNGLDIPRELLKNIPRVIDSITFQRGRKCTDGLCCFFPARAHGVKPYKSWTTDKVLLIGTVDVYGWQAERLADQELPKLLTEWRVRFETLCSCEELQLELQEVEGTLVIGMGCGVYETRPQPCRDYPESSGKPCTFATYCGGPRYQVDTQKEFWGRPGGIAIFLLALNTQHYPGFESWSIGQARDAESGYTYTLIPVPWFNRYRGLIPEWDETKGPLVRNTPRLPLIILLAVICLILWGIWAVSLYGR